MRMRAESWTGMIKAVIMLIGLFGLVFSGLGCGKNVGPPTSRAKVTLAFSTLPIGSLVALAHAKGFFADEGVDVTIQPHLFGKVALEAVMSGKADLGTCAETPMVHAVLAGNNIAIIATLGSSNKECAIVGRKDRGISQPADLKGKKIGVPFGTSGEFFMDAFFVAHRIERNEVEIIDLKPDAMLQAMKENRIDAVAVWNPMIVFLKQEFGAQTSIFFEEEIYTEIFGLVGMQEYVQKNQETIQRLLRGLIKAEEFARDNPTESLQIVAEFIKLDQAVLAEIWPIFNFQVTLPGVPDYSRARGSLVDSVGPIRQERDAGFSQSHLLRWLEGREA